jgi:hypothetical protein
MKKIITQLLNLPEVIIESSLQEGLTLILSVSKKVKSSLCSQCGKKSEKLHQNQKFLVKDLPMGDKEVIVTLLHQLQAMWCRLPSPVKDIRNFLRGTPFFPLRRFISLPSQAYLTALRASYGRRHPFSVRAAPMFV